MKIKIFALIVCAACLVAVLTACSGGSCTTCQDLDKNSKCDVCGIPVVTIVEKVPAEEEVKETVINPIPDDVKLSDVLNLAVEKDIIPANAKLIETAEGATVNKYADVFLIEYVEVVSEDAENPANTVYCQTTKLYDPAQDKVVLTLSSGNYTTETYARRTTYSFNYVKTPVSPIEKIAYEIKKVSHVKDEESDYYNEVVEFLYYTFSMDLIVASESSSSEYGRKGDTVYVCVNGVYYVVDTEINKVIHTAKEDEFVNRPKFNAVRGNYGFVENDGVVCVFDLTEWLKCVYTYEIPKHYEDAKVFYLENGKVLVQGAVRILDSAVNYDVLESGAKYDVVYTMLNPADKTATDVEFGYYIDELMINTEIDTVNVASAVKNILRVQPMDGKRLGKERYLFIDNDLNVLGDYDAILPEFTDDVEVVANNRALVTIIYGEGSSVRKIIDGSGKVIATLPNSAVIYDGFILVGKSLYDFDMKLVLDLDEEGYSLNYTRKGYAIMSKDSDIYYWSVAMGSTPKLIATSVAEDDYSMWQFTGNIENDYFVIITQKSVYGDNPSNTVTYTVYNAMGAVVLESESAISSVGVVGDINYFKLTDGSVYIAK